MVVESRTRNTPCRWPCSRAAVSFLLIWPQYQLPRFSESKLPAMPVFLRSQALPRPASASPRPPASLQTHTQTFFPSEASTETCSLTLSPDTSLQPGRPRLHTTRSFTPSRPDSKPPSKLFYLLKICCFSEKRSSFSLYMSLNSRLKWRQGGLLPSPAGCEVQTLGLKINPLWHTRRTRLKPGKRDRFKPGELGLNRGERQF